MLTSNGAQGGNYGVNSPQAYGIGKDPAQRKITAQTIASH